MNDYLPKILAQVLLVEDNEADADLVTEALQNARIWMNLHWVRDGVEAMAFLKREGCFSNAPLPDLILLDLNMPKKDGRQVLKEIREDKNLTHLPVVILTTSREEEEVLRSYQLHANCYITKPVDFDSFKTIINQIKDFWFSLVTLPKKIKTSV